jgi:catechol 2,3-dioxygenase-like lactoylglutathione lyase family enzyme
VTKTRSGDAFMPADEYGRQLPKFSVNLLVRSIAQSLPFYTGVLGATVRYSDDDFAAMRLLDWDFMLHADHSHDHHPLFERIKNVQERGAGAELRVLGIDPDETEKRARAAGSNILYEAKDFPHGWREISVADPDGYVWVVGVPNFWINELSLSSKTFEEYVRFLFDRAVVDDKEHFDWYLTDLDGAKYDEIDRSEPAVLVEYMTRLFSDFASIAAGYSHAQVDQGVWGIWGEALRSYELVFDPAVSLSHRLACLRSMYGVYDNYVSTFPATTELSGFNMWWDLLLHGFWTAPREFVPGTYREDFSKLDEDSRIMLYEMFETLKLMLSLPDRECQRAALHGLGHLHQTLVPHLVQQVIDSGSRLPPEVVRGLSGWDSALGGFS